MKHTAVDEFRNFIATAASDTVESAHKLRAAVQATGEHRPIIEVINRTVIGTTVHL